MKHPYVIEYKLHSEEGRQTGSGTCVILLERQDASPSDTDVVDAVNVDALKFLNAVGVYNKGWEIIDGKLVSETGLTVTTRISAVIPLQRI